MNRATWTALTVVLATGALAAQLAPLPASPRGTAATQVAGRWEQKPGAAPQYRDGKWIVVDYGRPILRGRSDIFGQGTDYGKTVTAGSEPVWRAGANQTTRLRTDAALTIGGQPLAAGEYSVFVELKEGAWTFILSTQPHQVKYDPSDKVNTFGAYNYDPKFDVLRAPMRLRTMDLSFDQFTIGFVNMTQQGGTLAMWWEKQLASVDFVVSQ
jgi:hypothetical protein